LSWLLLSSVCPCAAQDYSIFGRFEAATNRMERQQINSIYSKCFNGLQLATCVPNLSDDDVVLSYDRDVYRNLADTYGAEYCVECCGKVCVCVCVCVYCVYAY
jgi:hypothetical protein